MKQMTKKELKEKVYNEFLFGSDYNDESKIRVIKIRCNCDDVSLEVANYSCFYMDINHNYEKYTLERKCNIVSLNVKEQLFIGANNIIRNKFGNLQILDKELNDNTNDYRRSNFVNLHFKVNDNVIGLSSKSTIKESNIISPLSSNASELDTVTNFEIPKFDSFNVIMYFVNSKSNPVVFVVHENYTDDELDWYKLLEEKKYLYCSLDFKSFITTTTSNTNSVRMKIDDPLSISEKCYESSSIDKEIVKYDNNGEVIYYENPINMIKMERTIRDDIVEEKVFFRDNLIKLDYHKKEKYNHEEVLEYFGQVNTTKVVYDKNYSTNYTTYQRVGDHERICKFINNNMEDEKFNDTVIDPNTIVGMYNEIPRPILNKELSTEDIDVSGKYYYTDNNSNLILKVEIEDDVNAYKRTIEGYGPNGEVLFSYTKELVYIQMGKNKYIERFRSESGILFDTVTRITSISNALIERYRDNDIDLQISSNGEIEEFNSLMFSSRENFYIRDEFGIPRFIYYKSLKLN